MLSSNQTPQMERVKDGEVDVDNLIYYYANAYGLPVWVDIDSVKNCNHCSVALKSNRRHICRLDGRAYCSQCTTKLHLPEQYEQKQKTGASRVCYGCRMGCLRIRQASERRYVDSVSGTIFAPVWQDKRDYTGCIKCAKKVWSPHNCRCCGGFYCDDCSEKMELNFPSAFNKKNKSGAQRVCDGCRYRILAGAVMSEDPCPSGYLVATRGSNSCNSSSESIVVSTFSTSSGIDALLDIEEPLHRQSLASGSSNGVSLSKQDRSLLFEQKRKEHTLSQGPKVMLDTSGVVLRKVITPDVDPTTPGAPTVVNDKSILEEESVKPSQLRRTVAEGCTIPVPHGAPVTISRVGGTTATQMQQSNIAMPIKGNFAILPKITTTSAATIEDTENANINLQ